jgi:hypothetical protein
MSLHSALASERRLGRRRAKELVARTELAESIVAETEDRAILPDQAGVMWPACKLNCWHRCVYIDWSQRVGEASVPELSERSVSEAADGAIVQEPTGVGNAP